MGFLIAIEGTDGAGKGTQSALLVERARLEGFSATLLSFPHYGTTFFSQIIARFLNGKYGARAQVPPVFRALLFASERFEERQQISTLLEDNDIVVIDRYIGSNIAYQSAELGQAEAEALTEQILTMEMEIFGVPRPDLNIMLSLDPGVGQQNVKRKENQGYRSQALDMNEADLVYLHAVHKAYESLIERGLLSPWEIIDCLKADGYLRNRETIADEVWLTVEKYLRVSGVEESSSSFD